MAPLKIYASQIVFVTEECWYLDGDPQDDKLERSEKSYTLLHSLFMAADAEAAYAHELEGVGEKSFDEDGEGDRTYHYVLGIHDIEEVAGSLEELVEEVANLGLSTGAFDPDDADDEGIPLVREKQDLSIFLDEEEED